jgi:chromate reductase
MHALNEPEVMIANAADQFDAQGNLKDEAAKQLIRELLSNLVSWTRRLKLGKETVNSIR